MRAIEVGAEVIFKKGNVPGKITSFEGGRAKIAFEDDTDKEVSESTFRRWFTFKTGGNAVETQNNKGGNNNMETENQGQENQEVQNQEQENQGQENQGQADGNHTPTGDNNQTPEGDAANTTSTKGGFTKKEKSPVVLEIVAKLTEGLMALEGVTHKGTSTHEAFKHTKNFLELHVTAEKVKIVILKTASVESCGLEYKVVPESFGWLLNTQVTISKIEDVEKALVLATESYEERKKPTEAEVKKAAALAEKEAKKAEKEAKKQAEADEKEAKKAEKAKKKAEKEAKKKAEADAATTPAADETPANDTPIEETPAQ